MKNFSRKFGVELELTGGTVTMTALAAALTAAGVETHVESYGHAVSSTWKIVSDASLNGGDNMMELVSPILEGSDGLSTIKRVCKVVNQLGVTVNNSCGLHVHVDARGSSVLNVANLLRLWAKYEAASFDCLAPSRRNSRWAKTIFNGDLSESYARIARAVREARGASVESFIWRFATDRYLSLNLTSYMRHGSVEFRAHQGTTDADKICAWVEACVATVSRAFKLQVTAGTVGAGSFDDFVHGVGSRTAKFLRARRDHFASRRAA